MLEADVGFDASSWPLKTDGRVEALEACDTDDAVTAALLWQLTGTATGVASTAVTGVVVLW